MKILYFLSHGEAGGAELPVPAILRTFEKAGHETRLVILTARDGSLLPVLKKAERPYRLLSATRRGAFFYCRQMARIIRQEKPDLIWSSLGAATRGAQLLSLFFRIPVVSWKHSARMGGYWGPLRFLSAFWVADSPCVQAFVRKTMKIPARKVLLWPIFSLPDTLRALGAKKRPAPAFPLKLGSVGRLSAEKNYDLILQALALLKTREPDLKNKLRFALLGDGPEREKLAGLIASLGLEDLARLEGYQPDAAPFLANLDLYLQPSAYEGMCLAFHEAQGAGIAAIASPVGEMKAALADGNSGVLLEEMPVSAEEIADKISWFLKNPGKIRPMGKAAAKKIAAEFSRESFEAHGIKLIRLIQEKLGLPAAHKTGSR